MAMHFDVVDVFLVQESNFTNSGKERALGLLKKVKGGWLEDYQEKLVYLQRTEMPPGGFEDGKEADADMRRQLSWRGLERLENILFLFLALISIFLGWKTCSLMTCSFTQTVTNFPVPRF